MSRISIKIPSCATIPPMIHGKISQLFADCSTPDSKYAKLIELGRELPTLDSTHRNELSLVQGCQSLLYLKSELRDGKIYFQSYSEALISAGLAALLIRAYEGMSPQELLQNPPKFLEELELTTALLSPGRSNGLASLWRRMVQDALFFLKEVKNN